MARHYRQAPLNSIWEGSGNVICLDVLRAMGREPDALEALRAELALSRGAQPEYDACLSKIDAELNSGIDLESSARRIVERFALALQAHLLVQTGHMDIAESFMRSRLGAERFSQFGTLPDGAAIKKLIERAHPRRSL